MGIGTDNVYLINTDEVGKMDASHLGKRFDIKITSAVQLFKLLCGSQKVKFCALKTKALCRSWSPLLQVCFNKFGRMI